MFDVQLLREMFKGSKPNDKQGENVEVSWIVNKVQGDVVNFSKQDMDRMAANKGDLVYVSDSRKRLGGLKSIHSVYGEPHEEEGIVYISEEQLAHGQFVKEKSLTAEKEM